jgi:hypothetical protein
MQMNQRELHNAYSSAKWRRASAYQLRREPLCKFCSNKNIITPATCADHITPHRGSYEEFWRGALTPGGLMSLCDTCHSSTKRRIEHGSDAAFVRGIDANGDPVDREHPWWN